MRFNSTLRVTYPIGATLGVALLLIAGLAGAAELIARTAWARANYPYPSLGQTNEFIDTSWFELDRQAARRGQIDCIALGSSMILNGFDPQVFESVYQSAAGSDLACGSFGIPAMVLAQTGAMARLLNKTFQPRLLILGVAARDFSIEVGDDQAAHVLDGPWLDVQLGRGFSPEGWLLAHSSAYRDYVGLHNWVARLGKPVKVKPPRPPVDFTQPPDRQEDHRMYTWLANFSMAPDSLAGLEQVLALRQQGVQILVVEMPVHPTFLYYFGHGEQDQQHFRAVTQDMVEANGLMFWPADPNLSLPDQLWTDRTHLNAEGAKVFSQWLALKVAEAVQQGRLAVANR